MSARKLRFAFIGAGAIAAIYARAVQTSERATLVAIADPRIEAAQALAGEFGATAYADAETLVAAETIDVAIVCTPPATHEAVVVGLLANGVHVLCEKPFALDAASAQRMISAAERNKLLLTMGSKFRYVDDVCEAKTLLRAGAIGEPIAYENTFASYVSMRGRWNADPAISGGGVLIDNGTHSVDLMRWFLGSLSDVQAIEGPRVQNLAVEDTARIFARTRTGVTGSIDLSWSLQKLTDSYLEIYGTHGTIVIGWRGAKIMERGAKDWRAFGSGYDKYRALRAQVDNVAGAILDGEPLVITTQDALASVQVMQTVYHSLRRETWVAVGNYPGDSKNAIAGAA